MLRSTKKALFLIFLNLFFSPFFAQELLTNNNVSWQVVLPGVVLCEPALTSYGFSVLCDNKSIVSISNSGNVLWQKEMNVSQNDYVVALPSDFLIVVTDSERKITLLNPSGKEIWNKEMDFTISKKPFAGRDGRFFIFSENEIWCFGINGIPKWKLSLKNITSSPVLEAEDGSLLVCVKNQDEIEKTVKVSPFGEVSDYENTDSFYDENAEIEKAKKNLNLSDFSSSDLQFFFNDNLIFVSDSRKCSLFSENGNCLWKGSFENPQIIKYILFTQDNHLVLFNKDWNINSYYLFDDLTKAKKSLKTDYNSFYFQDFYHPSQIPLLTIDQDYISEERFSALENGFYGSEEKTFVNDLFFVLGLYNSYISSKEFGLKLDYSVFEVESKNLQKVLWELPYLSNNYFAEIQAQILRKCTNKTILVTVLNNITKIGYDPEGKLLDAIEVLSNKVSYKDEIVIAAICDSIYSVCSFMGRPAFNSKGKKILSTFFGQGYSVSTKTYCRNTFKKIKALDL